MIDDEDRDEDPVLDWALGEAIGSAPPPDLAQRVLARADAGELPAASPTAAAAPRHWPPRLAALLGVAVVLGVFALQRPAVPGGAPQEPPRPELVRNLADLRALPRSTRAIELRGLGDAAAALLPEFAAVEVVRFVRDDDDPLTDRGLAFLQQLPRLTHLELLGGQATSAGLQGLRDLPALRALSVSSNALDDAALAALASHPQLRELRLIGCRGFGGEGLLAITRLRQLQVLELSGTLPLPAAALAALGGLEQLTTLHLASVGPIPGAALRDFGRLSRLEHLTLADAGLLSADLQPLAGLRRLRSLSLAGQRQLDATALLHLPVGLESLLLPECQSLGAGAAALLRDRFPELLSLDLTACEWLDANGLQAVLQAPRLRMLKVDACRNAGGDCVDALVAAKSLQVFLAANAGILDDAQAERLRALRPDLQVAYRVW